MQKLQTAPGSFKCRVTFTAGRAYPDVVGSINEPAMEVGNSGIMHTSESGWLGRFDQLHFITVCGHFNMINGCAFILMLVTISAFRRH